MGSVEGAIDDVMAAAHSFAAEPTDENFLQLALMCCAPRPASLTFDDHIVDLYDDFQLFRLLAAIELSTGARLPEQFDIGDVALRDLCYYARLLSLK